MTRSLGPTGNRALLVAFCLLLVSVGGCMDAEPTSSTGDKGLGATTGSATPTSATAETPTLPTPVSAVGAPALPLGRVQTARLKFDSPDWMEVADEALWVKLDAGTVVRINPEKARVETRIKSRGPDQFELCQGFGTSGDSVWTCTPFGSIERIDASSNRVAERLQILMRRDQGHMVVASGRIWIATQSGDSIAGISLDDNQLGEDVSLGAFCNDLAAADPVIWAVCPGDNQVVRVDTAQGKVTARLESFHFLGGSQWGTTCGSGSKGGVAQVDLETLSVEAVYDVRPGLGGSIWVGEDRVWVRSDGGPFLTGIDPVDQRVVATITAPELPSGGNVVGIGDQLWATAYDDATVVRLRPPSE